ncbi:transcriptional regulator, TetR family [Williamsia sterculiae]|uniref:Transcriptional regulator, TetR family n=2 Tax=Williamsia sterculiae TaxID=1344003 RepID=A0A1N7HGV8_9NOCA|nr:transcriptional regulator, TetR family [Williamsia sterculiae]
MSTARRTRKSAEQRRDELLRCAVRVSVTDGLAAITLRRVATDLGVTPGLVSHYFSTAEQLVAGTFTSAAESDLERLLDRAESARPGAATVALIDAVLDDEARQGSALWLDAWSLGRWNAPLRAELTRLDAEWKRRVAELVAADAQAGTVRITDDAVSTATRLMTMLDGLSVQVVTRAASQADVRSIAHSYAQLELGL